MTRFAASLTLVLGSLAGAIAQAPDLAMDERLAKRITVRIKMATLPEAMTALTKAGSVTLESTPSLRDLKVTVLVKDQPTHLVMAKIASTLDLEWEVDGPTYRIKANTDVASAERRYVDQEDRLRHQSVTESLRKMASAATVPYELAKERDARLTPERYLLGQLFGGLSANQWTGFWNGRTVSMSAPLRGEEAAEPVSNQGPPNRPPGAPTANDRRRRGFRVVRVAARYDPIANQLMTSDEQRMPRAGEPLIQAPYPTGELAKTTFGKRVLAWESRDDKAEGLQKTFAPIAAAPDRWFGSGISAADTLEALHLASGTPIVADGFRVAVQPVMGGTSSAAWLTSYRQANAAFVRTEDGFATVRHGGFWRLRRLDAPERLAKALESGKVPALEDYAAFAAALTPAQGLVYRAPGLALLRVDPEPLRSGLTALRFYASLGSLQRQARQNRAIPFGIMGAGQRDLFLQALDGTFEGGTATGRGGSIDIQQEANALAFLLSLREMPNPADGGKLHLGTQMLFGVGVDDGVTYRIGVAPRS